jgi:hypothetical protein
MSGDWARVVIRVLRRVYPMVDQTLRVLLVINRSPIMQRGDGGVLVVVCSKSSVRSVPSTSVRRRCGCRPSCGGA